MIKSKFTGLKIRYKIILSMYIIIVPILLITGSYLYHKNYIETVKNMTSVYENLTQTVQENITYLEGDLLDISTYLTINRDIRQILNARNTSFSLQQPLIWEQSAPTDFVRDMISIKSHIKSIILYPENGIRPFAISQDKSVFNRDINKIHDLQIYKYALEEKGNEVWTRVKKNEEGLFIQNLSDKIVISREIFNLSKTRSIGFLSIGIDAAKYEQICSNAIQKVNEGIIICSKYGEELVRVGEIAETVGKYITSDEFLETVSGNGKNYMEYQNNYIFYSEDTTNHNIICYMLPVSNWYSQIQTIRVVTLVFCATLLFGMFPLFVVATTIISKPLNRLYHSMIKFKEGDFNQRVEVTSYDEIGEVSECFNQMVEDIKQLIDKNYVMVLRERQSELDALQAQINPHFLYNTLDSLYWQAVSANSNELAEDIFSLSQLFRLVLSQGQSEIPIAKERDLIFHYLQIQKMRFKRKLNFSINLEEAILGFTIPKLIIQPFVENAIVHGLERTGEAGSIEIEGYLAEGNIILEIKDNGVGMTQEQVKEIFEKEEGKGYSSQRIGRYAIKNIIERLNLKYHHDFKLQIQSTVGVGTSVTIVLPARTE